MAMSLWHYGTMALWLRRGEMVSGGIKLSREARRVLGSGLGSREEG
jgi:hypothetical protein